jgi:N12 class adenine-specific DNA methylase
VRDGGIVAFVTSTGTLDKKDNTFRKSLAEKADLIGAIRLPNNAFKAAGTEVTSDIIFLQKRSESLDKYPEWVNLGKTNTGLSVNKYFEEHPEMILGQVVQGNKMFGSKDDTMVIPFADSEKSLSDLLDEAVNNISATISELPDKAEPIKQIQANEVVPPENLRENSFFIKENSLFYFKQDKDGALSVLPYKEAVSKANQSIAKQSVVKDYVALRDTVRELLEVQQQSDSDELIPSLQAKLNQQYDDFYKNNGLLNSNKNSFLKLDTSFNLVSSLEADYDIKKNQLLKKADIFTTRTIKSASSLKNVDTPIEALAISIVEKGKVGHTSQEVCE